MDEKMKKIVREYVESRYNKPSEILPYDVHIEWKCIGMKESMYILRADPVWDKMFFVYYSEDTGEFTINVYSKEDTTTTY